MEQEAIAFTVNTLHCKTSTECPPLPSSQQVYTCPQELCTSKPYWLDAGMCEVKTEHPTSASCFKSKSLDSLFNWP